MTITIKPPPPQEAQLKYPCAVQVPYFSQRNGQTTKTFILLSDCAVLDISDGAIRNWNFNFDLKLWPNWQRLPSGTEIIFTQS